MHTHGANVCMSRMERVGKGRYVTIAWRDLIGDDKRDGLR